MPEFWRKSFSQSTPKIGNVWKKRTAERSKKFINFHLMRNEQICSAYCLVPMIKVSKSEIIDLHQAEMVKHFRQYRVRFWCRLKNTKCTFGRDCQKAGNTLTRPVHSSEFGTHHFFWWRNKEFFWFRFRRTSEEWGREVALLGESCTLLHSFFFYILVQINVTSNFGVFFPDTLKCAWVFFSGFSTQRIEIHEWQCMHFWTVTEGFSMRATGCTPDTILEGQSNGDKIAATIVAQILPFRPLLE